MKLITRVILICGLAVLAASSAISVLIWVRTRQSYLEEAHTKARQNAVMNFGELENGLEKLGVRYENEAYLRYFFKAAESDDYNVCFWDSGEGMVEIFNHTVFDKEFLSGLSYAQENPSDAAGSYHLYCARLDWEGRHYLVFQDTSFHGLFYYRIEDITYVWERLRGLTVFLVLVTAGVMLCAILLLSLTLKKVMKPLKELNESARLIAEGHYEKRITANSRDEIGQLSENFNKMAAAVELRTRSLQESERKKTLFMGNLTHELKTPMTAISGYAQTLLHARLSEEDKAEALLYIYQECGRLERLSLKMMKLLELDGHGELPLVKQPVKEIFEGAAKVCREKLREKRVTLSCSGQEQEFYMDRDLMTEALVNLIDNGVKASEPGGRILLRAGNDYIEVEDFGKGIPGEEQERIWEPFYMIDKSRSRKSGGAGLGLALVALIARLHHCRIEVESQPGRGTVIRLQFV